VFNRGLFVCKGGSIERRQGRSEVYQSVRADDLASFSEYQLSQLLMAKIGEVPGKVGRMRNVEPLDPPLSEPIGGGTPRKFRNMASATMSASLNTRENRLIWVCGLLVNGGLPWRALPQLGRSYLIRSWLWDTWTRGKKFVLI
jgi:hypothetical protein